MQLNMHSLVDDDDHALHEIKHLSARGAQAANIAGEYCRRILHHHHMPQKLILPNESSICMRTILGNMHSRPTRQTLLAHCVIYTR